MRQIHETSLVQISDQYDISLAKLLVYAVTTEPYGLDSGIFKGGYIIWRRFAMNKSDNLLSPFVSYLPLAEMGVRATTPEPSRADSLDLTNRYVTSRQCAANKNVSPSFLHGFGVLNCI